jgi:hypothetical protein
MHSAALITFGFWIGANMGFLMGGFVCLWGACVAGSGLLVRLRAAP